MSINNEISKHFEELIKCVNPLDYFSKYICPAWEGNETIKKAILLMLASKDTKKGRGRIHILFSGKEGTGKSMLIDWLVEKMSAYYCDANTTRAGLTADARGKDLALGLLAKAHNHILVIDELEFLQDREALRDSMERGWFKITKGKIEAKIPARVKIVGSLNDASKLSPPLRSRFDFHFEFVEPSKEESKKISQKVLDYFFRDEEEHILELKEYLKWIENFEPSITEENLAKAKEIFEKYFEHKEVGKSGRWIASVTRIARTIAKLHRRDIIPKDFIYALALKDKDLNSLIKMGENL